VCLPTQLERTLQTHSAGAYSATLLVIVNVMKGDGRAPLPSPAWANFTLMMECTSEAAVATLCTLCLILSIM
jgi:hypothetical protein